MPPMPPPAPARVWAEWIACTANLSEMEEYLASAGGPGGVKGGSLVYLRGVTSSPEMNGRHGTAIECRPDGKWVVDLKNRATYPVGIRVVVPPLNLGLANPGWWGMPEVRIEEKARQHCLAGTWNAEWFRYMVASLLSELGDVIKLHKWDVEVPLCCACSLPTIPADRRGGRSGRFLCENCPHVLTATGQCGDRYPPGTFEEHCIVCARRREPLEGLSYEQMEEAGLLIYLGTARCGFRPGEAAELLAALWHGLRLRELARTMPSVPDPVAVSPDAGMGDLEGELAELPWV